MIKFISKIIPIAGIDRIGQNSGVGWTRLFGHCPGHRDHELVAPMRAHRPIFPKNGRCAREGAERHRVVSDFERRPKNGTRVRISATIVAHHSGSTETRNTVNVSRIDVEYIGGFRSHENPEFGTVMSCLIK